MATPLLPLLGSVISDPAARADFLADPAAFLRRSGWELSDLAGADLHDALAYAAASLPAADALVLDRFRLGHGDASISAEAPIGTTLEALGRALVEGEMPDWLAAESVPEDADGFVDIDHDRDWFQDDIDSEVFIEGDAGDDATPDDVSDEFDEFD